jgi:hypothetical protein
MVRRYKGIEDSPDVFAKARRVLADQKKTNEQGAKSTNPESGEDENETAEADVSGIEGRRDDLQAMNGNESTRPSIGWQQLVSRRRRRKTAKSVEK